jgi:GT2 family glycosyltransferase/2-polyprenyl-3-methyl-5-hydroxy-6-metoxy-1,4-benzoquinol methylase/glycosyltransferase involved in cell wall biosynthesis
MNPFDAEARLLYDRDIDAGRRNSLAVLLDLVPSGADVLDVGIGGGALGEYLGSARGCRVDGATISPVEAARAAPHYRRIEVADLNVTSLDALFDGRRYDAIICADVLEHLPRPTAVLDSCRKLLADDGRLLLSIPNVAYSGLVAELLAGEFRYRAEGLLDRTHVRFFTRRSALRLLREQRWQVDVVKPVYLDLRDSEFRPDFDLLPPAVRRYLLARPDGLTYQFIVQARPAAATPSAGAGAADRPETDQPASYSTQLYLKDASGYAEDRKLVVPARIGERRQRISFPLPTGAGAMTGLRFDPADRPGFLNLFDMRLLDAGGGTVWTWDGEVASLKTGDGHDVVFQTPWSAERGVVLLFTGDDPYFELPVGAAQLAACGERATLEVELSWPMSPEYLLFVDELAKRGPREQALESELAQAREQAARHEAALAAAQAQVAQQHVEAARAAEKLAAREEQAGRLAAQHEQLLGERRAREAELRRAGQEIASLTHALGHVRARSDDIAGQRQLLLQRATDLEASRWTRLGARLARLLGRAGSPLLRSTASLLPAAPPRALRAPRAAISIVVPVYKGLADTQTCLESVLRSTSKAQLRIVVVDDASPEPEITSYLQQLARRDPRVELLENLSNLGFVASANLGMQRHADDDVILLNSDTEVHGDWIDRLREAAYRGRGIATVSPFSNAATICSYPRFCVEGAMPADLSTAALDRYFAAENAEQSIEVPTAVGFCMFVRRDCLDEVGLFDAERFGRGYGEENDFCMRARATGWRHVLALDTFVRHSGGVSFGAEKADRVRQAQELLATLHPDYAPAVARHLQEDPARTARLKVDLARIRASGLPSVLFVSHAGGGGTERHLRELAGALATQANVFLLRPTGGEQTVLEWLREGEGFALAFRLADGVEALLQALRAVGVAHVHFHHTRGQSPSILDLPGLLGVTHDYTAHDFFALCPQVTLSDEIGRYCGEFGAEQCGACLIRRPAPDGGSIEAWRVWHGRLLEQARHVFAPSADAVARLRRYFPSVNVVHVPHPDIEAAPAAPAPQPLAGRPLRIVVMGALSQIKGADVFEATAALASQRGSPLQFHLLGYAYRDLRVVPGERLTVHGEYAEKDLPGLLQALQPDLAWFPALWPETYSYTLSAALNARLPVVAPDLGAFPERLSGRTWTWVCPWYWLSEEWVQFFEGLVARHFEPGSAPGPAPLRPTERPAFSYARDYLRGVQRSSPTTTLPAEFLERHRPAGNS